MELFKQKPPLTPNKSLNRFHNQAQRAQCQSRQSYNKSLERKLIPRNTSRKRLSSLSDHQKQKENQQIIKQNKIPTRIVSATISPHNDSFQSDSCQYFRQKLRFPPPKISSKYWAIYEVSSCKIIWGLKSSHKREVASLTKIMTAITTLKLCQLFKISLENTYFRVSPTAANITGTTARLQEGTWINVEDLLYALLLPSGNDAAYVLAESLGALYDLHFSQDISPLVNNFNTKFQLALETQRVKKRMEYFQTVMNKYSKELGVLNSNWASPHGLSNKLNLSTASDIGKLGCIGLQYPIIKEVVRTKQYKGAYIDDGGNIKSLMWQNTNKLLEDGWEGLKTGQTNTAVKGPCLSALKKLDDDKEILIVILQCTTKEGRWSECKTLLNWVMGQ